MKAKPYRQQIIALVLNFMQMELGEQQIAEKMRAKHLSTDVPEWIFQDNILLKKGIIKAVKNYVQNDKKVKEYYLTRKQKEEENQMEAEEEIEQKIEKPKKKKKTVSQENLRKVSMDSIKSNKKKDKEKEKEKGKKEETMEENKNWINNKFQAPKKLQEIETHKQKAEPEKIEAEDPESQVEEQVVSKKKNKQKKNGVHKKKPVSSDQSSEEEQTPVKTKKIKKQKKQTKAKEVKTKPVLRKQEDDESENQRVEEKKKEFSKKPTKTFSRIKPEEVGDLRQELKDNTFEAKFKFGKGDQWGKHGYEKLKDTRGDSFKKTKGKLKNKAFQGSNIDFNVINSIPL